MGAVSPVPDQKTAQGLSPAGISGLPGLSLGASDYETSHQYSGIPQAHPVGPARSAHCALRLPGRSKRKKNARSVGQTWQYQLFFISDALLSCHAAGQSRVRLFCLQLPGPGRYGCCHCRQRGPGAGQPCPDRSQIVQLAARTAAYATAAEAMIQ